MKRKIQGRYENITIVGEKVKAFVPSPLPPSPSIDWHPELRRQFDEALISIGRLDSISFLLPDMNLFLYSYVRKEAVLSSMIEGTQSSLSDLLLFEANEQPGVPLDDVQEVSNYVDALNYGLKRIRGGFPISLRLIREMHQRLLSKGRGADKTPGEFRRTQNWIGGTRPGNAAFVPPPPDLVMECMGAFELFLHDLPKPTPVLLKAALAHVQFETVHPFLDGNGRLGRLLITMLLCDAKALSAPILYLSLFFKNNRQAYYELLNRVRIDGDWEAWLDFFAEAVITTAKQAADAVHRLEKLPQYDRKKLQGLGRASDSALRLHREFLRHPITTARALECETGLSHVSVNKTLDRLCKSEVTKELTGQRRNRVFSYPAYISILNEGNEKNMI